MQQTSFYETSKAVAEYLLFHYGSADDLLFGEIGPQEALGFPSRCGELHQPFELTRARALDLGCATGGAAFTMSSSFEEVLGIDYSSALIDAAERMGSEATTIPVATEGDLTRDITVSIPSCARPDRVAFQKGDAMALSDDLGQFDFILMANLIDRLPDPAACLASIPSFLAPRGILAITSPYTWLEEYTPKEKWLGGYLKEGKPVRAFERLQELLSPRLELLETRDMPFLIREHERKNQFSIAQATLWRKR